VSAFFGKDGLRTASDVAARLLSEAFVVAVPGEPFGTTEHIRLSYAVAPEVIDQGIASMREWFGKLS
jgi:aspartate aminotransferase